MFPQSIDPVTALSAATDVPLAAHGPYGLWTLLGVMMLMFGVAWLLAARTTTPARPALVGMAAFNVIYGAGLLLVDLDGILPALLTHTTVSVMHMSAIALLWRAGAALTGAPDPIRELRWVVGAGAALVLLFGLLPASGAAGLTAALLVNAWLAARGGLQLGRQMLAIGGRHAGMALMACGILAALALIAGSVDWGADGLRPATVFALNRRIHLPLVYLCMVTVVLVNLVVTYHVFGRVLRDLRRVAESDPLTGLADRATVQRALRHEAARHLRREQPLAVVTLAIDQLERLRAGHGQHTCDAVIAEIALQLRLMMRPADVVGHAGDGVFLVLLPYTTAQNAARWARTVLAAVSRDDGLHPDTDERLGVSAGMAMLGSGRLAADEVLQRAEGLCRAAQAAGGSSFRTDEPLASNLRPAALRLG